MPIKLRPLVQSDREDLNRLLEHTQAFSKLDVQVALELIDAYLEDSINCGYYFIIAEELNTLAGYVCYGPTPLTQGTWDLYWIVTAGGQQRKGIAGSLIKSTEEDIRQKQGRLILIETSSGELYSPARHFYLKHDYSVVSVIPDFYSPGDDRITYRKIL